MLACQMEYLPEEKWGKEEPKVEVRTAQGRLIALLKDIRFRPHVPGNGTEDSPGHYSAPLPERSQLVRFNDPPPSPPSPIKSVLDVYADWLISKPPADLMDIWNALWYG